MKPHIKSFPAWTALTLILFLFTVGLKAQKTLTVYNGTNTNAYAPVYCGGCNRYTRSQYVIPAKDLKSMVGGCIYSLIYYPTDKNYNNAPNGNVNVYIKEVNYTTISTFEKVSDEDLVYNGKLSITKESNTRMMTLILTTPYVYKGGNLLIDFENTATATGSQSKYSRIFNGTKVTGAAVNAYGVTDRSKLESATPTQYDFIPKTTFQYYLAPTITDVTSASNTATVSWKGEFAKYHLRYCEMKCDDWGYYSETEDWTEVKDVTSPYTIKDLKESTSYAIQVKGITSEGIEMSWTKSSTVAIDGKPMPYDANVTQVDAHDATIAWSGTGDSYQLEYRKAASKPILSQDFENGLDGWTLQEVASGTDCNRVLTEPYSGSAFFSFNTNTMHGSQYLISPRMVNITSGTQLSFYYKNYNTDYIESFKVGYSSTTSDLDAFTFGSAKSIKTGNWTQYWATVPAGTRYICIQSTSVNKNFLFVDNIEVYQPQTVSDWNVISDIKSTSTCIEGLEADTEYEFQIRSISNTKSGESASEWTKSHTFKTSYALQLADDDTYAPKKNADLLDEYNGMEVDVTIPARKFTEKTPSTVCLPFDYKPADGIGTFYTFSGIEKNGEEYVATMKENAVKTLTANTPYLFMPAVTGEIDFSGTYTINASTATSTTSDDWTFKGTYSRLTYGTEPMTGHVYGFASKTKEVDGVKVQAGEFIHAKTGASVPAMRCYLIYKNGERFADTRNMTRGKDNEVPQSIIIRFEGEDSETSLTPALSKGEGDGAVYNLSGQRLSKMQKGINIVNGKKVLK